MAAEEQLQGFTVALECKARWADLILQGVFFFLRREAWMIDGC